MLPQMINRDERKITWICESDVKTINCYISDLNINFF